MSRMFQKQLQQRLPHWIAQGWITAENGQRILAEAAAGQPPSTRYLTLAFSLLGVILIGSGVITFFAANWAAMSKLAKLLLLFAALGGSYALAGLFARREMPVLSQAMLLLGVILFGSNIMLIAQIYHISAHYPDGVLTWALGGLLVAYLMGSQPAMVAALGLAVLWTGMESQEFGRSVHWPFLIFLAAGLHGVFNGRWRIALHVALAGLLLWSWFSFLAVMGSWWAHQHQGIYLVQVFFLAYLALFIGGLLMHRREHWQGLARTVQGYASFAALACLYLLTFPDLLQDVRGASGPWWWANALALLVLLSLAFWHYRLSAGGARPAFLNWGLVLLGGIVALLAANLYASVAYAGWLALLFNLVYFLGLLWLLYAALHLENRALVNQAFFFFAITLLARYFDTFWSLMDRSLFFMGGGLLLLGGGYWLERQRRKLTRQISAAGMEVRP